MTTLIRIDEKTKKKQEGMEEKWEGKTDTMGGKEIWG